MIASVDVLRGLFPRAVGQTNTATTGLIPIELFDRVEDLIRPHMRAAGLRAIYRGPRVSNRSMGPGSMTRRCDATGVLLYWENR